MEHQKHTIRNIAFADRDSAFPVSYTHLSAPKSSTKYESGVTLEASIFNWSHIILHILS